ncbi:pentapeptide repeat-containing protein [Azospirillum sp. TSA6c]|uniref:pentapeptide repeat-containing protein n=1 Tax=unclassified Azospirillum TaxID=2630922 RepID=UPI000D658E18|nr:pentapeptide repeat-containing protein [Azospirillum sp. TSA6c]
MVAVERASLVRAFGKVAVDLADLKFASAIKGVIDATGAFKADPKIQPTAEEGAKLLLQRAAYAAAIRIIQAEARNAPVMAAEADSQEIEAAILGATAETSLDLTEIAFTDPERWPGLVALLTRFDWFMRVCAVPDDKRPPIRRAFADALPLALAGEWRNAEREKEYQALRAALEPTPFDPAAQRSLQWNAYRDRLVKAMDAPLRALNPEKIRCSLNDLYVPLRAAVGDPEAPERTNGEPRKRTLVWLDDTLYVWATRTNHAPADRIRVLSGEAGAGKSSACMRLAALLAAEKRRVLLVSLTRLNIAKGSLEELARYLASDLGHDPFNPLPTGEPLVLILDGLDELAKSGQGATVLLNGFIADLGQRLSEWNRESTRVLLLLAGRPGATGAAVATGAIGRDDDARLHVLRYNIADDDCYGYEPQNLANLDQRSDWWHSFDPVGGMPEPLKRDDPHIDSLTEQPLLNWLLAQILTEEGPERAATISGVHDLYTRLFGHVLDRIHRRHPGDGSTEAIDPVRARLEQMLEEVAVAAWHAGTDRAVPLSAVERRLEENKLSKELRRLSDNTDAALTTLLDSFFCRAHQGMEYRLVEFTHKSFGQFLTARRVVRLMPSMPDTQDVDRYMTEAALRKWLELCGPAVMDWATYGFLSAQVAAEADRSPLEVTRWRNALSSLLVECLETGMPMPDGVKRSRDSERLVRNAEIAMLCAVASAFSVSVEKSDPIFINPTILAATLHRLSGPMMEWSVARDTLHIFDLSGTDLMGLNLTRANLIGAKLRGANLTRADLMGAKLTGADLRDTDLTHVDLTHADLRDATLMRADLTSAALTRADLMGAGLNRVTLVDADLIRANLTNADLAGADLRDADLTGADLRNTDLTGADLRGTILMRADLTYATLTRANLTGADLRRADLTGANLTGADLTGANLEPGQLTPDQLNACFRIA